MTKSELPLRLSAAPVTPQSSSGRDIRMSEPEQSSSYSDSKQRPASARDIPQESRELQEATTHLNATLDRSNEKMQKIIDKTRAQLPEHAILPEVPQLRDWKISSPPGDCGCKDELYNTNGCQCYDMARSEIAGLTTTLTRGLKRKEPERETKPDDDTAEVDTMWYGTGEELTSPLVSGGAGNRLRRHSNEEPLSAADQAEQKILQRHPDDVSQKRTQIMPLLRRRSQQQTKAADEIEQRMLQRHPDDVSRRK